VTSILLERLSRVHDGIRRLSVYRELLRSQIQTEEAEIARLRYQADLQQKCAEVFKTWLEDSLRKNVDSMSQLVTTGLRHVVYDQNLTFRIRQEMKHNRLSMRFTVENEDDHVEADPMTNFGGGAVLVISLILRLAVMARMKMGNLIILDESMSALANHYVPSAGAFMRQLSEEMGVNILMVTHNEEFLNHAHTAYEGRKEGSLRLVRRAAVR
jgi:ABC-type iron transport system FetAB ATPase subunit